MLVECPEGFTKRFKKDFIHVSDICWNRRTKSWILPPKYGSSEIIKSVKEHVYYSSDKRIEDLISRIRWFSSSIRFGRSGYRTDGMRFADILWLAGIKEVVIGHSNYLPPHEQFPENILINTFSFVCRPRIEFPFTNGNNFLHWVLNYLNIGFSGGANSSRMQASFNDKEFIVDMVLYFQAIKDQFGNSVDFYKEKNQYKL